MEPECSLMSNHRLHLLDQWSHNVFWLPSTPTRLMEQECSFTAVPSDVWEWLPHRYIPSRRRPWFEVRMLGLIRHLLNTQQLPAFSPQHRPCAVWSHIPLPLHPLIPPLPPTHPPTTRFQPCGLPASGRVIRWIFILIISGRALSTDLKKKKNKKRAGAGSGRLLSGPGC